MTVSLIILQLKSLMLTFRILHKYQHIMKNATKLSEEKKSHLHKK